MSTITEKISGIRIRLKTIQGELVYRALSKTSILILSLVLSSEHFGFYILFVVVESIVQNVCRLGIDRLMLKHQKYKNLIPFRFYSILVIIISSVLFLILNYLYSNLMLVYAIIGGLLSSLYFLILVEYRIENKVKYSRYRFIEAISRFIVVPLFILINYNAFVFAFLILYAALLYFFRIKLLEIFTISRANIEFINFSKFAPYSLLVFGLASFDRLYLTYYLGLEVQGVYSKVQSLIAMTSFGYLILGFVFEPKIYTESGKNNLKTYLKLSCLVNLVTLPLLSFLGFIYLDYDMSLLIILSILFFFYPIEFAVVYLLTKQNKVNTIVIQQVVQMTGIAIFAMLPQYFTPNAVKFVLALILVKVFVVTPYIKQIYYE